MDIQLTNRDISNAFQVIQKWAGKTCPSGSFLTQLSTVMLVLTPLYRSYTEQHGALLKEFGFRPDPKQDVFNFETDVKRSAFDVSFKELNDFVQTVNAPTQLSLTRLLALGYEPDAADLMDARWFIKFDVKEEDDADLTADSGTSPASVA